jgi:hypothetical protein
VAASRRAFLSLVPATVVSWRAFQQAPGPLPASFPSHNPDLAREIVAVSHGNGARVRELLNAHPSLANAAWDWGYGDWESALGAASHVGNREIAGLLLNAGARPSIFSAAMLGQLDAVKAFVTASPGVQRIRGPHGITLLAHAKAGGPQAADVLAYLESLGDADPRYTNEPLSAADRAAVAGMYSFGDGANDRFSVTSEERGSSIQRAGAVARPMFHLGGRVFHPTGAVSVRIRFAAGERAASLTVEDGPLTVVAVRV